MSFGMLIAFSQRMIAAKALKKTYLGVSDEPALPLLRIRTAVAVATIVLMPTVGELFGEWLGRVLVTAGEAEESHEQTPLNSVENDPYRSWTGEISPLTSMDHADVHRYHRRS